jgi:hypothetical protein
MFFKNLQNNNGTDNIFSIEQMRTPEADATSRGMLRVRY